MPAGAKPQQQATDIVETEPLVAPEAGPGRMPQPPAMPFSQPLRPIISPHTQVNVYANREATPEITTAEPRSVVPATENSQPEQNKRIIDIPVPKEIAILNERTTAKTTPASEPAGSNDYRDKATQPQQITTEKKPHELRPMPGPPGFETRDTVHQKREEEQKLVIGKISVEITGKPQKNHRSEQRQRALPPAATPVVFSPLPKLGFGLGQL